MAIDAFSILYPRILNTKTTDTIVLLARVGNSGNTAASGALFIRDLIVPAGVKVTVINNGGAVSPENGSVFEGPATIGNVYPGLTLPPATGDPAGPAITLQQFSITLKVEAPAVPITMTQTGEIFAPGDVNVGNNTMTAPLTVM
jgi:hypothetical protein